MNTGLNGWFGRKLKGLLVKVANIVDSYITVQSVGFIDTNFTEYVNDLGSGGGGFWNRTSNNTSNIDNLNDLANDPRGNYEPTKSEAVILDNFSDELTKIVINAVEEQAKVFDIYKSNATNIYKYSLLNALLQRIAVIKEYYRFNTTTGLSTQAIDLRNLMVEVLFYKIIQEVENVGFQNQSYDLEQIAIKIPQNDFIEEIFPFEKTTQFPLETKYFQFKEKGKFIDPKDEIPVDVINPVEDLPNPFDVEPQTKKSGFNWWWLVAGFIGYKILN